MYAPLPDNALQLDTRNRRVLVDARGDVETGTDSVNRSRRPSVELQTSVGMCLLRKLDTTGLRKREAAAAIELWAQESLPLEVDQYLTCRWKISDNDWGLAAIPLAPLARARNTLDCHVKHLIVPELSPPADPRCGALVWMSRFGLTVCIWKERTLCDWQSFSMSSGPQSVQSQLMVLTDPEKTNLHPDWLLFSAEPVDEVSIELYNAIADSWPDASLTYLSDCSVAEVQGKFAKGQKFDEFIHQARYEPVDAAGKSRLAFAVAAVFAAGCFFVYADLENLEQRVDVLKQQDLSMSVRARRSEQVAKRSSDALTQIYDLQAMTVERSGILHVLKALEETLPPGAKLLDLDVQRSGKVTVNGAAQTEVDVNSFLDRLERVELLKNPKLIFSQQESNLTTAADAAEKLIRFNVEIDLAAPLLVLPGSESQGGGNA